VSEGEVEWGREGVGEWGGWGGGGVEGGRGKSERKGDWGSGGERGRWRSAGWEKGGERERRNGEEGGGGGGAATGVWGGGAEYVLCARGGGRVVWPASFFTFVPSTGIKRENRRGGRSHGLRSKHKHAGCHHRREPRRLPVGSDLISDLICFICFFGRFLLDLI
jgi:hypothetical protein